MKIFQHGAFLIFVATLCAAMFSKAQEPLDGTQALLPDYNETGRKLPPGVPKIVNTNGDVMYVDHHFTTAAYQNAALDLVIAEANLTAQELNLTSDIPITKSNIAEYHISPFGFAYAFKKIGSITTKNYVYFVSGGNKFSGLTAADYDKTCFKLQDQGSLPIAQLDTNAAYQLASQWLMAMQVDVKKLNQDCKVEIFVNEFWNGLPTGAKLTKPTFVPIYDVSWLSPKNQTQHYGDVVFVELHAPSKTLLQFSIEDPKYLLRKPMEFTNMGSLFPGVATVRTNIPANPTTITEPMWSK